MRKLIVFETILIIFFVLAWSLGKADKVNNLGYGTFDCGRVVSDYDSNSTYELNLNSYIIGVISGMLIATNNFTEFSSSAIMQETINNCRKNPLKKFMRAIEDTYWKII